MLQLISIKTLGWELMYKVDLNQKPEKLILGEASLFFSFLSFQAEIKR